MVKKNTSDIFWKLLSAGNTLTSDGNRKKNPNKTKLDFRQTRALLHETRIPSSKISN